MGGTSVTHISTKRGGGLCTKHMASSLSSSCRAEQVRMQGPTSSLKLFCRKIWLKEHRDQHCGWSWSSQFYHHVLWLCAPQLCLRKKNCKPHGLLENEFNDFILDKGKKVWGVGQAPAVFRPAFCDDSYQYWHTCSGKYSGEIIPLIYKIITSIDA